MTKIRKTPYLYIKQKREPKHSFNRSNYLVILQLYHVVKTKSIEPPRLPTNDFRMQAAKNKIFALSSKNFTSLNEETT